MPAALEKDDFYKRLRKLVIPIMIQSFMLALVSATDAIMLGFVDQTSLSAVSLGGQVQFVLNMFVLAISAGVGVMAAQYWGKGDVNAIERMLPTALRFNILIGAGFTAAALCCPAFIMKLLTNDAQLIECGAAYLRAVAFSYLLCSVSQIYLAILKNTGMADKSSLISSSAVVFNIIGNAVLIFGLFGAPKLGIVGAAYATVAARVLELLWAVYESSGTGKVRVRWDLIFTREKELADDYWKYTVPILMAALVWGIAYTLHTVILGHMGADAVAANSVTTIARSLISCLIRGLGGGTGVLIGNILGSNDLEKARIYGGRLTRLAVLVGVITGLLLMLVSPVIVRLAPLTETAGHLLQGMLIFCGINLMFQAVNHVVLDGIFCSGGDSKFDMIGNIFAMWLFAIPAGFAAAFLFKAPALVVYCIVNLDEIIKIPAVYLRYKKYIWLRNITRDV